MLVINIFHSKIMISYLFVLLGLILKKTIKIQLSHIISKKHENRGCGINVRFSGVLLTKPLNEHFFHSEALIFC